MNCTALENHAARRILLIACAVVLGVAFGVSPPEVAHADHVTPPSVPSDIQVPAGKKAFVEGHAVGTQNYICLPSASGFAWTLFGPQATLFKDNGGQIITHFLSPNPDESGTARATWQHSKDTSTVWAAAIASSSNPKFVARGAIPWLLLRVVGDQPGPTGSDQLLETTHIQRLNTSGGMAPSTGCSRSTDVGTKALVSYTADYVFYKGGESDAEDDD
jgi:Protein of unknown function (DUF3455)